jgi:hypothetical protein
MPASRHHLPRIAKQDIRSDEVVTSYVFVNEVPFEWVMKIGSLPILQIVFDGAPTTANLAWVPELTRSTARDCLCLRSWFALYCSLDTKVKFIWHGPCFSKSANKNPCIEKAGPTDGGSSVLDRRTGAVQGNIKIVKLGVLPHSRITTRRPKGDTTCLKVKRLLGSISGRPTAWSR